MKMLKLFLVAVGCVFLASCLEINEEVQINDNGSGQVSTTMDMAQLIDMMQAMGGEEFDKKKDEKIDSVISLKDFVDTAKNLTKDQKAILRNGTLRIKMNMAQKEFNLNMKYPFTSLENLQKLNNALANSGGGFGGAMKNAMGNGQNAEQSADSPEMDQIFGIFDYNVSNGLIKKSVNKEKLKALQDNPKMAEMKQGADMGIEILYNVTYKLPRPAKNVDNAKAKLSDDKKTVTIRGNLMEIFTNPDQFAFTIQY